MNEPRLRFKEFNDEWENTKLSHIAYIKMGQSPNSSNYTKNKSENILIQGNADLKNGYVYPRIFTREVTKLSKKDDLIFTVRAPVGEIAINQFNQVVIGRGVASIRADNNYFIFSYLYNLNNKFYWNKFSSGSVFDSISSNDLKNSIINVPNEVEQQKIGSFFEKLDKLIQLQSDKLEHLKAAKKGYLQKMFPSKNSNIPKLRFNEYKNLWNNKQLSDVSEISQGTMGDASLNDGKYKLTRIETISGGVFNYNRLGFTNKKPLDKYILQKGDILFSNINSLRYIGNNAIFNTNNLIYHGINLFRIRPHINQFFLYYQLNTVNKKRWAISHANPAVSQASINKTSISEEPIEVTNKYEQSKISSLFKNIDQQITLQQQKLDNLEQQKKAYLQKMFI